MTIEQLQTLIIENNVDALKSTIESFVIVSDISKAIDQYEIEGHDVLDPSIRQDKSVYGESESITDESGMPAKVLIDTVRVARIPLPVQKRIVMTAAAFLGVPEMTATPETDIEKNLITIIGKVQEDNKFDYKFNKLVKLCKSEKQSAILIYTQPLGSGSEYWKGSPIDASVKFRLRYKLLARSLGDEIYPLFDDFGDMIAFARYYKTKSLSNAQEIDIEHLDIYTDDKFYFYTRETDWQVLEYPNNIGKIPVIYFSQPYTDWHDVEALIERLETKVSNHADTNDYYDSPIVKAKGDVKGFSKKGEAGKVLQMGPEADASYMTYDSLPASMEMEMNNLKEFIDMFSHTPNTTLKNLMGLGYFSTVALKVMFMDAHLKAYDSEEIFGEGAQRLYNYLKKAISVIAPEFKPALTMQIKPVFNYFLPKNEQEEVQTLISAYQAGGISERTFVSLMPFVEDTDAEFEQIEKEKEGKVKLLPPVVPPINSNTVKTLSK